MVRVYELYNPTGEASVAEASFFPSTKFGALPSSTSQIVCGGLPPPGTQLTSMDVAWPLMLLTNRRAGRLVSDWDADRIGMRRRTICEGSKRDGRDTEMAT